jgi:hypothetical protein
MNPRSTHTRVFERAGERPASSSPSGSAGRAARTRTEGNPLLRRDRLTDTIRGHRKYALYAGAALALAGTGSASAATVTTSSPASLATPTIAAVAGPTSTLADAVVPVHTRTAAQHNAAQHPAAAHPVAPAHLAAHRTTRHVVVRHSGASHRAAHRPLSWNAVSAELNRETNPAAAAHGIKPAADRLLPVATTGSQSWMPISSAQYANATTIVRHALAKRMGIRSAVVAVATAMQESRLMNLAYGTGNSLGLFQQQWGMGWGSPQQIMNPGYASDAFLNALRSYQASNPSWASQPLYTAAQGVQRSAFPYAYAQWESQAAHLTEQIAMQLR